MKSLDRCSGRSLCKHLIFGLLIPFFCFNFSAFANDEASDCEMLLKMSEEGDAIIWNERLPQLQVELAQNGVHTSYYAPSEALIPPLPSEGKRRILRIEPTATSILGRFSRHLKMRWDTPLLSLGDDSVFAGSYISSKTPALIVDEKSLKRSETEGPLNHEFRHLIVDRKWDRPIPGQLQIRPLRVLLTSDTPMEGLPEAYAHLFSLDELWAYTGNLRQEMKLREKELPPEIKGHTPSRQLARYLEYIKVVRPFMSQLLMRQASLRNLILDHEISTLEHLVMSTARGHIIAISAIDEKPDTLLVNLGMGHESETSMILLIHDPGSEVWQQIRFAFNNGQSDEVTRSLGQILGVYAEGFKTYISESLRPEKNLTPLVKKLENGKVLNGKESETYRTNLRDLEKAAVQAVRIRKLNVLRY